MFHSNLKNLREKSGLSQKQIAEQLNISPQSVSKWEKGAALPSINYLPKLAECLNCDINAFFADGNGVDENNLFVFMPLMLKAKEGTLKSAEDITEIAKGYPHIFDHAICLCKTVRAHTIIHFSILKAQLNMSEFYACIFLELLYKHKILAETTAKDTYAVNSESLDELISTIKNCKKVYGSAKESL